MLKSAFVARPIVPAQQRQVAARAAQPSGNPAQPAQLAGKAARKGDETPVNPKTAEEAVNDFFDRQDAKKGTKEDRTADSFNLRNNASVGSRFAAHPEKALDDNQRK